MHIRITILFVLVFLARIPLALGQTAGCSIFHNGQFHVYLATSGQHYIVYRDDQTEKDVVDGSTDTLVWHIQWLDDCDYTVQYVPNGNALTKKQEKFFKNHKLCYHLQPAGKDFCVYTETVDKVGGTPVEKDTMWLHEASHATSPPLAIEIRSESLLRNMRFSDTSRYAVVYIYRPKAMMFSAYSYDMYAEDNVICGMKNNSSFIFAVYRKGPLTLRSRYRGDTCAISLNIEAGKTYYVRSTMHFGMFGSKNYKLVLEPVPAAKGKEEFDHTFAH